MVDLSAEGAQTLSDDNGRMLPMLRVVCEKKNNSYY